jgi:Ca-activated chloride channel homolog
MVAMIAITFALASCGQGPGQDFAIVSGSENQPLEPLVQEFCKQQNTKCSMSFQGSLDIGMALQPGRDQNYDAVWPASHIWVSMFDTSRRVSNLTSISQNPVVLGVRKAKAEELGWTTKPVAMADILAAVEAGNLHFLMTSATQSNSGASAYLAMLSAALGKKDVLTTDDLKGPAIDVVQRLLRGVERSSGSSGWLADLYVSSAQKGVIYDAMWNYEAVIKDTNDKLRQQGKEPLWAVYPTDGISIADSPLGFVERGRGADVRTFFDKLQAYLLSPEIQARIAVTGRRVATQGAAAPSLDPSWNFDPTRLVSAVPIPEPKTIQLALNLYQESLRQPSLTAFCLDFSGSMQGDGESQLRRAVEFLLTPYRTAEVLVQWSPKDRILIIPFNNAVLDDWEGAGDAAAQAFLLNKLAAIHAGGGTDMYACARKAGELMKPYLGGNDSLPAIVIMTDGRSQGNPSAFLSGRPIEDQRIPIFGITFGDAQKSQLDALANATGGRVFDGTKDLTSAFRAVRGYN